MGLVQLPIMDPGDERDPSSRLLLKKYFVWIISFPKLVFQSCFCCVSPAEVVGHRIQRLSDAKSVFFHQPLVPSTPA